MPYPLLGENTLVLSDTLCLRANHGGKLELVCRVADTYATSMVEARVHAHLFRYRADHLDGCQHLALDVSVHARRVAAAARGASITHVPPPCFLSPLAPRS